MKKYLLMAGVCFLFTPHANAEDLQPYVGLDLGGSRIEYSNKVGGGHADTIAVANLNLGAKFNKYFGFELSSQASSEADVDGLGDLSYSSLGLDAVGYIPLNDKFEFFALAGVGYYNFDLKLNQKIDDLEIHATKNETAFRAGLGLQYSINDKWAVRCMAKYHHIDNDYFDYIGEALIGVRYNF